MALIRRLIFLALLIAAVSWPYTGRGQTGAKNGEWRAYGAEEASTRYSPIDQITRDNVKNLQVAWTWKFDNYGSAAQTATTETTPLMVGRHAVLHGWCRDARSLRPMPGRARRCGPGGPMRAPASMRHRARSIAAWRTGPTARRSASFS